MGQFWRSAWAERRTGSQKLQLTSDDGIVVRFGSVVVPDGAQHHGRRRRRPHRPRCSRVIAARGIAVYSCWVNVAPRNRKPRASPESARQGKGNADDLAELARQEAAAERARRSRELRRTQLQATPLPNPGKMDDLTKENQGIVE